MCVWEKWDHLKDWGLGEAEMVAAALGGASPVVSLPTQGMEVSWGESRIPRGTKPLNSSDLSFFI